MSRAINWDMLESQFKENEAFRKELNKMVQIRESVSLFSLFHQKIDLFIKI